MTAANFSSCLKHVLSFEGGFVNHPADPGGATNMGITRKTLARWRSVSPWWALPVEDVRALQVQEAAQIYRGLYWAAVQGNTLPAGVDLALFDFAVNSGPSRAVKTLQSLLAVKADGVFGPLTLRALQIKVSKSGAAIIAADLCDRRMDFLTRLKTFNIFGRGWTRRVKSVRSLAVNMAGTTEENLPKKRRTMMNILSGYKTYIIGIIMLVTGLAQFFGVDVPGFDGHSAGQLITEGLAIVFLRKGLNSEVANS